MSILSIPLYSAADFLVTARNVWENLEHEEEIKGTLTLSLEASAPLHHGDLRINFKLYLSSGSPNYRTYEVEGQDLSECMIELRTRVLRDLGQNRRAISFEKRGPRANEQLTPPDPITVLPPGVDSMEELP